MDQPPLLAPIQLEALEARSLLKGLVTQSLNCIQRRNVLANEKTYALCHISPLMIDHHQRWATDDLLVVVVGNSLVLIVLPVHFGGKNHYY